MKGPIGDLPAVHLMANDEEELMIALCIFTADFKGKACSHLLKIPAF